MSCDCTPAFPTVLYFPGSTAARFRQAVTVVGSDPVAPQGLTGATVVVVLKQALTMADDAAGNVTLTVANGGIVIVDPATLGLYDLVFRPETTATLQDYVTWYAVPRITLGAENVQVPRGATLPLRLDPVPPSVTCGEFAGATLIRGDLLTSSTNATELDPPPLPPYATETYVDDAVSAEALARANADTALGNALVAHTGNTSNPHNVTKAQVGLGNVDNTPDSEKPISTQQAAALLGKRSLAAYTADAVATSNVAALTGLPAVDDVDLAAGQILLLVAQSTATQNGPWVVAAGGWTRPDWYPSGGTVQAFDGVTVHVTGGYDYGNTWWRCHTSGVITIGATATSWAGVRATSGVAVPVFIDDFFYASTLQDFIQFVNDRYYELPTYGEVSTEIAAANIASGARTSLGTLSTAGNTDLTVASALTRRRYYEVTIGAGSAAFTRTLTALTANASAGDELEINVTMPAGVFPTVELRNATSGGTLLATVPTDALASRVWTLWSRYTGTAWGTATVTPRDVVRDYLYQVAMQRVGTDQVISDGSTTGRGMFCGPFTSGTRGWMVGQLVMSYEGLVTIPPAGTNGVIVGLSNTTTLAGVAWRFLIEFSAGEFRIRQMGATSGSDFRDAVSYTSFRTAYNGMSGWISVVITKGTTSPVVKWNGVDVSAMFELRVGGTYPEWMPASGVSTYHIFGDSWAAGAAAVGGLGLGALTDAERQRWITTGKPPMWWQIGGSAEQFNVGAWTVGTSTGILSTNTADAVVVEGNTAFLNFFSSRALWVFAGQRVQAVMTISGIANGSFTSYLDSGGTGGGGAFMSGAVGLANGTATYTWVANATGLAFIRFTANASGNNPTLSISPIVRIGALSIPLIQRGGVLGDSTMIGDNPARLVGMRAITDRKDFIWTATVDTSSTGTKQLLGGAVFTDPLQTAIDSIDRKGTGAETASVGDGTTVAKYSASAAKTAIINSLTLAEKYPADSAKTGIYYDVTVAGAVSTKAQLTVSGHVIP